MRRTALAMEQLLHTVREEVPDTASTLRLSGLELADCIEEVSMLRFAGEGAAVGARKGHVRSLPPAAALVSNAGVGAGAASCPALLRRCASPHPAQLPRPPPCPPAATT